MSAYRVAAKRGNEMEDKMDILSFFTDEMKSMLSEIESKNVIHDLIHWHGNRFLCVTSGGVRLNIKAYSDRPQYCPIGLVVEVWNSGWVQYCDFDYGPLDPKDCTQEIKDFVQKIRMELIPHLLTI